MVQSTCRSCWPTIEYEGQNLASESGSWSCRFQRRFFPGPQQLLGSSLRPTVELRKKMGSETSSLNPSWSHVVFWQLFVRLLTRVRRSIDAECRTRGCPWTLPTEDPMWGYPVFVLGAVCSFLEPFRGHLSPNIDNVSEKLTLRYPHKGPWVDSRLTVDPSYICVHARDQDLSTCPWFKG